MSKSILKKLKATRESLFEQLKRFREFLSNINDDTIDQLEHRIEKFETIWSDFQKIQLEIETWVDSPENSQIREEFDNQYFKIITQAKGMIRTTSDLKTKAHFQNSQNIKLPEIQLPQFDGTIENWVEFRTVFETLVHNNRHISDEQKFHYLKTNVKGEAAAAISAFALEKDNYQVAYQTLLNRYQSPRRLGNFYLQLILKFKSNGLNPQKFLNVHESAINALKALRMTDLTEFLLFQLSYNNLDTNTQQAFDLKFERNDITPTTTDLLNYIRLLAKTDELKKDVNSKHHFGSPNPKSHFSEIKGKERNKGNLSKFRCSYCHQDHFLAYCPIFKTKSWRERKEFTSREKLCSNCLGAHSVRDCWSQKTCKLCRQNHHSLLHPTPDNDNATKREEKVSTHFSYQNRAVLLSTATIVIGSDQNSQTARALIDQGSEASFISESLVQRLRLKRKASSTVVSGVGSATSAVTRGCVRIDFASRHKPGTYFNTEALILPKLTDYIPPKIKGFPPSEFDQLLLADEDVFSNQPIEVILGAEMYALILQEGILRTCGNTILLQNTRLGWIFCGALNDSKKNQVTVHCSTLDKKLLKSVERFWQMEEPKSFSNQDDLNCEDYFQKTCQRTKEGRFVVRLPFKEKPSNLGESREAAHRAMNYCEKKLSKNLDLSNLYHEFLQEYQDLGHMEVIHDVPQLHYFLPHHGVLRPSSSTTKLRVVFNASKKTSSGKSLNDVLHIGPQLLPNVQDLFLRWRKYKIVFSADVEKMYRQILVNKDDQCFQLILWKNQIYQLKTVTYGTSCAPYLAMRVLRQLADEEPLPLGKEIIYNEIYMDDVLSGANDEETALEKQRQLIELFMRGGFVLRKWTSNNPKLLNHLPQNLIASSNERDCFPTETYSMLGIRWQRDSDLFIIKTKLEKLPSIITKRIVLSSIARLFDPLGYAAPILIKSKIFLQSLWLCKLGWDDPLPEKLSNQWRTLHLELESIHLKIPRWIYFSDEADSIEIHGFSDASEKAMSAVLYISIAVKGIKRISLLGSKTKVAPIKPISLPRLELTAAVLLTRLLDKLISALALPKIDHIRLWTDSTVTLFWIKNHPSRWTTFVANRVTEIQNSAPKAIWSFVPSGENPADCATRGLTNAELKDFSLWWLGPSWMKKDSESWPNQPALIPAEAPEQKKKNSKIVHHIIKFDFINDFISRFSCLLRLLRTTSYCLRFLQKIKEKPLQKGPLTPEELHKAKLCIIKRLQEQEFNKEYKLLKSGKSLPRDNKLLKLNPILDDSGIIRVGGRLKHSLLDPEQKHPVILPSNNHFTKLVVREAHKKTLHGGIQITLATLRREWWILRGRQVVKSVIHRCVVCRRFQSSTLYQKMADLPKERIVPSRPFLHSGVDFAGPIQLRTCKGRGHRSYKGYIAVFVCFFSRAVHLEAVTDYTAESFLAAYRRFTSRRGLCATLTSDRGTNFIGAAAEMKSLFETDSLTHINDYLTNEGTVWRFIPPYAPHFGGLWEAAVKAVKYHLKRVIGDSTLTYEEISTLLCQIEGILNSRPLQPLTEDPEDPVALTPAHFLIGSPIQVMPDPSVHHGTAKSARSRFQLIQAQKQAFWRKWSQEYIHHLQSRPKWRGVTDSIVEGDLVLIKNELTSPSKWPLARVLELHRGSDGLVRVVSLKTATSTVVRPITKLVPILDQGNQNV